MCLLREVNEMHEVIEQREVPENIEEAFKSEDLTKKALQDLRDIRDQVGSDTSVKVKQEIDRLIQGLESSTAADLSLAVFLSRQPTEHELEFPDRYKILLSQARVKMTKSKFFFPDPAIVVSALTNLCGADAGFAVLDYEEIRHRVLHSLARISMPRYGFLVSMVTRRICQAGGIAVLLKDPALPTDAPGRAQGEQTVADARRAIREFLKEARYHDYG